MPPRPLRAVPDQPQRAVLYRRVSSLMGRSGDDFHSPDLQLEAMRRMASQAGLREVAIVDDIDVSGQTFSRAGIDRIRDMVENGRVDVVALYDLSRLGRDLAESLTFIRWLRERGVSVMSSQERIDDTPEGQFMLAQFLGLAQLYGRQVGRRWGEVIARRAAAGHHHGKPFGYTRIDKRMHPHPVYGPIVTWAFDAYAQGHPIGQIARTVSDRRGTDIATVNLKKLLQNPVYLGHVTAHGEIVAYDAHPPLTNQKIYDAVQARIARDRITPSRHLQPTWSLVGVCFCPDGHRLQRQPSVYRGERIGRLICGRGASRGAGHPCPGIGGPRLDLVEAEVLRQVSEHLKLLGTDEAARAAAAARRSRASVERNQVERELTKTRAAMTKLAKAWAMDEVPDAAYYAPMAELRAAEAELERQVAELAAPAVTATPRATAAAAKRLLGLWPSATVSERSRLIRLVVRRVVVRRASYWREPEADRVTVEF